MDKKILIIGNSVKAYALAKYLSKICTVYVAPGTDTIKEFAECIDIRENAVPELLEFAMETGIDMTIPVSALTLSTDIVKKFADNNLQIFAPLKEAHKIVNDKTLAKKILYKLRIPTPKFGIFEKQAMALDYIKNLDKPFVIKTNEPSSAVVLSSNTPAKNIVECMFAKQQQRVLIEDYVCGTPFSFYAITDGYKALPFGTSLLYKHSLEGDGGQLTSGMGACSPNNKLTIENEKYLLEKVIYPTLEFLEREGNPYIGILGVNGILTDNNVIQILGYQSFMQDSDCQAILDCLDTELYNLMSSCIIGSFSDEIDIVEQKDINAISLVIQCKNKDNSENTIYGLDEIDDELTVNYFPSVKKNKYCEYEATNGAVLVLTTNAKTVNSAVNKIYSEASRLNFKGISYRKDICKPIDKSFFADC
ncbi:MAG: hypothetical protein MJ231_01160 [bacterium]|nr:hypothetical protein [bacterium]